VSYLRIPAPEPARAASFYADVFGWRVQQRGDGFKFEDRSGHVIGHFVADLEVAGEAGVRPYVYVDSLDRTIEKLLERGGAVVTDPYPEGDLRVATFRDPSDNVIGIWERAQG
jgi:predicted enzyme related to lactoylglutathione lyase